MPAEKLQQRFCFLRFKSLNAKAVYLIDIQTFFAGIRMCPDQRVKIAIRYALLIHREFDFANLLAAIGIGAHVGTQDFARRKMHA